MKIAAPLFAFALFASLLPVQAGETAKYPVAEPAFTFDLPEKWTAKPNEDGHLVVSANDDSGFFVTIRAANEGEIGSAADAKTYPAKLAKGMSEAAQLTDIKTSEVSERANDQGVKFYISDASGKIEGQEMVMTAALLVPSEGKYYLITSASPEAVEAVHLEQIFGILTSMKPTE